MKHFSACGGRFGSAATDQSRTVPLYFSLLSIFHSTICQVRLLLASLASVAFYHFRGVGLRNYRFDNGINLQSRQLSSGQSGREANSLNDCL